MFGRWGLTSLGRERSGIAGMDRAARRDLGCQAWIGRRRMPQDAPGPRSAMTPRPGRETSQDGLKAAKGAGELAESRPGRGQNWVYIAGG